MMQDRLQDKQNRLQYVQDRPRRRRVQSFKCRICGGWVKDRPWCVVHSPYAQKVYEAAREGGLHDDHATRGLEDVRPVLRAKKSSA